jgi:hypothetical protein
MSTTDKHTFLRILLKPQAGTVLAVASGLSFFFLCMLLPLVGPSGSKADHAAKNTAAFLGVLVVTFLLAALAAYSKLIQRRIDGGPFPYWSMGLCVVCVLALCVLLMNGFAI